MQIFWASRFRPLILGSLFFILKENSNEELAMFAVRSYNCRLISHNSEQNCGSAPKRQSVFFAHTSCKTFPHFSLLFLALLLVSCEPDDSGGSGGGNGGIPGFQNTPLAFREPVVSKSRILAKGMSATYVNPLLAYGQPVRGGVTYKITKPGTSGISINQKTGELRFYNKADQVTVEAIRAQDKQKRTYTFRVTDHFKAREAHSSVVLGGAIYVIGGLKYESRNARFNDVWKSTDGGATWTQVTTPAIRKFSARYGHSSIVMDGAIYVIGGHGASGTLNDVWKSTDGATWTEVTTTTNPRFPARFEHSSVVIVEGPHKGMYVIGGQSVSGSASYLNDVWKSTDGASWTQVISDTATTTTNQFSQRAIHSSVSIRSGPHQGIYVIGGIDASTGFLDDVWKSTNGGQTWTKTTSNMKKFNQRVGHSSFVIGDTIYIIGGRKGPKQRTGGTGTEYWDDVCKSTDGGATWEEIQASGSKFSKRDDHSSVVMEQGEYKGIYVIGGFDKNGNFNSRDDVWKSTDLGQTWRNVHTIPQRLRPAQR